MVQCILKLGLCTIQDAIKTKPVLNVEMTGGWWKPQRKHFQRKELFIISRISHKLDFTYYTVLWTFNLF